MTVATPAQWLAAPVAAAELAEKYADVADDARRVLARTPLTAPAILMYQPDVPFYVLRSKQSEDEVSPAISVLRQAYGKDRVDYIPDDIWEPGDYDFIKLAHSPFVRSVGETMNLVPGKFMGTIPNSPGPLASMLTSGLLGAGLGYGAGWLGENLLPETFDRGRLRKTLGVLGGMAGALPGAMYGISNQATGKPFDDNSVLGSAVDPRFAKSAAEFSRRIAPGLGLDDIPPINVDKFNQTVWEDPYVSNALPLPMQGVASAVLSSAQQLPGGVGPGWVTPMQMGRLAAGMGAGYVSGSLVGGLLGLLTGMPEQVQDTLKRTGAYAGIVSQAVPLLFGGR